MQISVDTILAYKNQFYADPIKALHIPNVLVPKHLKGERYNNVRLEIRAIFNALTQANVRDQIDKIVSVVQERVIDEETIDNIATEIFESCMVLEKNVPLCVQLLNAVCDQCVLRDKARVSKTIGDVFVDKCRVLIRDLVSVESVQELAEYDQYDIDDLDLLTKERDKTCCVIAILCQLYDQRHTNKIKLTAEQLIPLFNLILGNYYQCTKRMQDLGNPKTGDCSDEDSYFLLDDMRYLYIEQLYSFIAKQSKAFLQDKTMIGNITLGMVVNRFRKDIVPSIQRDYLTTKCESIKYN